MLEPLIIEQQEATPGVTLDKSQGKFLLEGRSFPEDANVAFGPLKEWFQAYIQDPNDKTLLELRLDYFNSATAHVLASLMVSLEALIEAGKEVNIHWYYAEGDDVMQDRGEELGMIVQIPFQLIPFQP